MNRSSLQRRCFALDLRDDAAAIERYQHWHRPGGPPAEWQLLDHIYSLAAQP